MEPGLDPTGQRCTGEQGARRTEPRCSAEPGSEEEERPARQELREQRDLRPREDGAREGSGVPCWLLLGGSGTKARQGPQRGHGSAATACLHQTQDTAEERLE